MIDVHHVDACPSKITVFLGSVNCEANAAVYPCDATDQHIEWYSNDPGIATVNPETGYISGVSLGRTKIYAQATNGSRAGIVVEVVPAMIEEIWLESTHRNIGCDQEDVLIANVRPETAVGREIFWRCTDPTVITLTPNGYQASIKGNKLGNAVVIATAKDEYAITDCCGVNVVTPIQSTGVEIHGKVKVMRHNDSSLISASVLPLDATNRNVIWESSNPDVAEVEKHSSNTARITTKNLDGVALIKAKPADNENCENTDVCKVIVDTREKATIVQVIENIEDFDVPAVYNTVTFENTGRTWRFIHEDYINWEFTSTNSLVYELLQSRLEKNMYETIWEDGPLEDPQGDIEFSDEEMQLIYGLDPHGLSAYVQAHATRIANKLVNATAEEKNMVRIAYKNRIFSMLFNKEPDYYLRNDITSKWEKVTENEISSKPLEQYLSESELLFGTHPIYDGTTKLVAIDVVLVIAEEVLKIPNLSKYKKILKSVELFHKAYNMSRRLCEAMFTDNLAACVDEIVKECVNEKIDEVLDVDWGEAFDCVTKPISWVTACYNIGNAFGELAETFASSPLYLKPLLDYSAKNPNYSIHINFVNADDSIVTYRADSILDAIEALRNSN